MSEVYQRLTPEEALKLASEQPKRGKLKIFIGYAPGVGKSYTMLNEGGRRRQRGEDIVIGYVEIHGRAETEKQIGELEVVPRKKISYGGKALEEMDTEAIIRRHPATVLIDELAHTNVPGSKYAKRYEDVREVLAAGINVVTTLNVQHLESLNDLIKQITGVVVRETIPDSVVEKADEVVAVDITVEALINRLKRGDVYRKDKITEALNHFFREGNLTALREISLRQTAQEVDEELEEYMKAHGIREEWQTTERILVCVSPSPNAKKLIRRGALIARRYRAEWFVVAVENSGLFAPKWGQKEKTDLESHFILAKQLGAQTLNLSGRVVSDELARFAQSKHITQIVIGHSEKSYFRSFVLGSITGRLLSETRNIAIHVIPVSGEPLALANQTARLSRLLSPEVELSDFWKALLLLGAVSVVNFLIRPFLGYQAIGYLFLLTILVMSLFVSFFHIIWAALLSAFIWNFFFIPPLGSFRITRTEDLIMTLVYIFISLIAGYLTSKIRQDEKLLAIREARTDTLHRITSIIAGARDPQNCIRDIEKEVRLILSGICKIIVKSETAPFDEVLRQVLIGNEKELSVAMWAYDKGELAGWSTETLSFTRALYVPLKGPSENIGVLSYLPANEGKLSEDDQHFLISTANQLAFYLEREIFRARALIANKCEGL